MSDLNSSAEHKIRFDPRISMGHIMQAVMIIGAITVAWQNLDKRVVILETSSQTQVLRDKHQDALIASQSAQNGEALREIKEALIRLDNKIEELK